MTDRNQDFKAREPHSDDQSSAKIVEELTRGRWLVHFMCRSHERGNESIFAFCRDEDSAGAIASGAELRHAACADTYCAVLPEEDYDAEIAMAKWKDAFFTVEMERAQLARELEVCRTPPVASPSVECPTCSFNADPGCQRCRTPPAAPPQKELLDALIAASKMCGSCRGSGRYSPHCYKCDDSGEEHIDCPPERDCGYPTCIATRAAITAAKESR